MRSGCRLQTTVCRPFGARSLSSEACRPRLQLQVNVTLRVCGRKTTVAEYSVVKEPALAAYVLRWRGGLRLSSP